MQLSQYVRYGWALCIFTALIFAGIDYFSVKPLTTGYFTESINLLRNADFLAALGSFLLKLLIVWLLSWLCLPFLFAMLHPGRTLFYRLVALLLTPFMAFGIIPFPESYPSWAGWLFTSVWLTASISVVMVILTKGYDLIAITNASIVRVWLHTKLIKQISHIPLTLIISVLVLPSFYEPDNLISVPVALLILLGSFSCASKLVKAKLQQPQKTRTSIVSEILRCFITVIWLSPFAFYLIDQSFSQDIHIPGQLLAIFIPSFVIGVTLGLCGPPTGFTLWFVITILALGFPVFDGYIHTMLSSANAFNTEILLPFFVLTSLVSWVVGLGWQQYSSLQRQALHLVQTNNPGLWFILLAKPLSLPALAAIFLCCFIIFSNAGIWSVQAIIALSFACGGCIAMAWMPGRFYNKGGSD